MLTHSARWEACKVAKNETYKAVLLASTTLSL
ncbi:hypothetical protein SAMN05444339_11212 [Loktanella atrilutea]|uniref:Uncharacterized protein n=1 Tax=Loktanella atrilutea TaxID=366533 RepID=A0A1M5EA74_LOKAT|nr:hypothetical protein SAMN05444339_11212 [Loktanella atrilutea]